MSTNQAGYALMLKESPRRWDFLSTLMQSMGLKTFVEVGCKEGRVTGHLLRTVPDSFGVAIDPWAPIPNSHEDYLGTNSKGKPWDWKDIEAEFWANVGENKPRVQMLRMI